MEQIRHERSHPWLRSICTLVASRLASGLRKNRYQVPVARRRQLASHWGLLQISYGQVRLKGPILQPRILSVHTSAAGRFPEVAPSNSHLFGPLKKHLPGTWFWTDADAKQVVTSWLQIINTDIFDAEMQALVSRWNKRLNVKSDNVEVWCLSSEGRDSSVGIATRYGL
jgi:hypothetical protein